MLTNFPNGITSFGVPVFGGGGFIKPTTGKVIWVDGTNGLDGNDGSFDAPLKTIYKANSLLANSGDTVMVLPGTYTESAITCTVAGARFIGLGTSVKQVILTSATDTKTLTLGAGNIEVAGFYFKCPTRTSGTPAAIQLSSASYANIHHNRFQGQTGSYNAIYSPVCDSDNVTIANNEFMYLNTATYGAAILGVEAGGLSYSGWNILNNKFSSCVTNININGRACLIKGNDLAVSGITAAGSGGTVTTTSIDLSGTSSYGNMVHGNYLGGTYSIAGGYTPAAGGDDWSGNFNIAGVTSALPA